MRGNEENRGQKQMCVQIRQKDKYMYIRVHRSFAQKKKSTKCFLKISIAHIIYIRKFGY